MFFIKHKFALSIFIAILLSFVLSLYVGAEPTTTAPSDLTGYTVTVPSGWSASSGYGNFNIDYTFNSNDFYNLSGSIFGVGFTVGGTEQANTLNLSFSDMVVSGAFTISISGGSDSSSSSLIQWFAANNATFDNGSSSVPDPEPTVTSIPIGSYSLINPLVNIPDIDWMDGTGYSYTYDCSGTMSYGGRITTIQNFAFDLDYFQTSSIYDLTISVFTGDEWIDIALIEIYNATRTVTPLNGFQYIFFSEDVVLDSNSYETFFDIFEFYDPDEVQTPDNPWIYILEKVIDALKVDLWGNFSPWDIFSTLTGIFIVVWILKLIAGG